MPRKGFYHQSEEHKANERKAHLGKHQSAETIAKRIAKIKGTHCSEATKAKIRESQIKEKSHRWKGNRAKPQTGRGRANRMFLCPKGMQRHHIDGNPLNNSLENIMFVTPKQHMIIDGRLERRDKNGRFA